MISLSPIDTVEVRLVSVAERQARRRRLWGAPAASAKPALPANVNLTPTAPADVVALYRLSYSSKEAAMQPLAACGPAPSAPTRVGRVKSYGHCEGDRLLSEVEAIARARRVSVADIRGSNRTPAVRLARREACYALVTRHPELSYIAIGVLLKKDRSSVRYAARRHAALTGLPPIERS